MADQFEATEFETEADREYYDLQRVEDALYFELGDRAWLPLIYVDEADQLAYLAGELR